MKKKTEDSLLCPVFGFWRNKKKLEIGGTSAYDRNYEHQWKEVWNVGPELVLVYCIKCGKKIYEK